MTGFALRNLILLGKQFSLFVGVGAIGTVAHYLLFVGLVELSKADILLASMAGFLLGAAVNYVLNYRITFRSNKAHTDALPKFMGIAAVGFVLNSGLMWLSHEAMHVHYFVSQIGTTTLILVSLTPSLSQREREPSRPAS
jgi:putative flippase GtrA